MENKIPHASEVIAAIKLENSKYIDEFYDHNMNRIIRVLQDFIDDPSQIPNNNKCWFNMYEPNSTMNLAVSRKHVFKKELELILDNLKANGYNCWYGTRDQKISGRYTKKIVTLEISFEEDIRGFFEKLLSKKYGKHGSK